MPSEWNKQRSDPLTTNPGRAAGWMGRRVGFHPFPASCRDFSFWEGLPGPSGFSCSLDLGWACQRRVLGQVNLIFFLSASRCQCLAPVFLFGLLSACCAYTCVVLSSCVMIYYSCPCRPTGPLCMSWKVRPGWQPGGWWEPWLCSIGAGG